MSKKLLLADDSVVIQKLVGLSFANEDVEIVSTDNGDDAVIRAREVIPDVILADVVMPGKNGYEVCEAIKRDPVLAHIPVLLLTGTFEAFDEAKAGACGANGHITKPFEAQALVTRVTEVMDAPVEVAAVAKDSPAPADLSDPAASHSDFFDANVISLTAPDSNAAAIRHDAHSPLRAASEISLNEEDFLLNEPGESRSALFGQPSDVLAEDLSDSTGTEAVDEGWATPSLRGVSDDASANMPETTETTEHTAEHTSGPAAASHGPEAPPTSEPMLGFADPMEPPPLPHAAVTEAIVSGGSEPFSDSPHRLANDFGLDASLADANVVSALEVDTALASGPDTGVATILVADNDSNAMTSRGDDDPTSLSQNDPRVLAHLTLKSGAPQADPIELNPSHESLRSLPPSHPVSPPVEASVVANLDARLAEADLSLDVTLNTDDENFLDIGPTNMTGEDFDFAFDVSEQQPISDLDDPLDQSYSSLIDISDSQILIDPSETSEPLADDYDVSSSDLDATPPSSPVLPPTHEETSWLARSAEDERDSEMEGEPENDRNDFLISVPDEASIAAAPVEDSSSATPVEDSFLAAPVEDSFLAAPVEDSSSATPVEDSFLAAPVEDSFLAAPVEDSSSATPVEDSFLAAPVEDSFLATPVEDSFLATPVEDSAVAVGSHSFAAPGAEPVDLVPPSVEANKLIVGENIVAAQLHAPSMPDLSPMMEQQIQETLEKVAWEAFSDLSETIVKQVMSRVEQIAWDVIPQMAETLVREEIRRMKGEDD